MTIYRLFVNISIRNKAQRAPYDLGLFEKGGGMLLGIVLFVVVTAALFIISILTAGSSDKTMSALVAALAIVFLVLLVLASYEAGQGVLRSETALDENGVYVTLSSADLGDGGYAVVLREQNDSIIVYRMQSVPPPVFIVRGSRAGRSYVPFPAPSE